MVSSGHRFFLKCVKLLAEQLWQIWRRYAPPFFHYLRETWGGGADNRPPTVRGLSAWRFCTALLLLFRYLRCFYPAFCLCFVCLSYSINMVMMMMKMMMLTLCMRYRRSAGECYSGRPRRRRRHRLHACR